MQNIIKPLNRLLSPELLQKLRFALVGVVNTATAYLAFVILFHILDNYIAASVLSYIVGMLVSFVLNRGFVFKSSEKKGQFLSFCVVNLFSLGCSTGTLYLLVDTLGVYVYLAQALSVCVSMVVNYLGYRAIFTYGVTMNKAPAVPKSSDLSLNPAGIAKFFMMLLFLAVTIYNMHIALLETVAHDALPFMESYVEKFTSEGRWINFAFFEGLRELPQWVAFPLCNLFVFIFGYQVANSLVKEKWIAFCFALTLVNIPYFTMLFKWPMTLVAGMGLLALFSYIKDRVSVTAMLLISGIALFATYPAFYFLMPLLFISQLRNESFTGLFKFLLIWIAGYALGYGVAQLSVFVYTFLAEGHGHFIEFAGWRKSTPMTGLESLLSNIEKSAGNFERNALYISELSPLFFIPVALVLLWSLKAQLKYTLVVLLVVFSIYASVIALGVNVPLRSGITLPIGMAMIALLVRSSWGKGLLLATLFIPFAYKTYTYNHAYHEKRVILRSIIEPADPQGLMKQPQRFGQVIVTVDEKKMSEYFHKETGSDAFKNLTNLREHYIKPYFYNHGWKEDSIKVVDTPEKEVTGKAEIETKGDTLYLNMD
ncbi:GtrA family protein [Vibrio viridaestus]|uniref:GtrA family protein n=1 Tax=Vibrio viridaestus TaxID=2487322 RepID=A0A3N9TJL4_9VIBR|nr:GtrA family protein [Vibrio viridaestus]RQW64390.1 GtrA family protein [Vibrio viridaestus]